MPSLTNNNNTTITNNNNNNNNNNNITMIKQNIFQHGEQLDKVPEGTNVLIFHHRFNNVIKQGYIPDSVTHIVFGSFFNKQIQLNTIPQGVKFLQFGYSFDQQIIPGSLPDSLQQLTFGDMFNRPIEENTIPSSVIKLVYGDCFYQELNSNSVPSSVRLLKLGSFNKQVKDLKKGCVAQDKIISLKIKGQRLPSSIEQLSFGCGFNQPIPDDLISPNCKIILVPQSCTFNSSSIYSDKIKLF
ncbi:hypothetical protein RB653_006158 [Dictyostelium firmibasis]|uniref:FNIP repeat-containing protein n=1 Tax=Dictyostelium firmibasis TaxID=79012 RepID=A0AAN7UBJ7_9MYCE